MAAVYEAGMRHVDHFWNAMSSTDSIRKRLGTPQRGSMAEFVLYHPEMSTEVIADGFHHAPEMLQFAYRMKGPARLCLVSDCSRALDTPPGIYRIGHHETGEPFENNGTVGVLPGDRRRWPVPFSRWTTWCASWCATPTRGWPR